VTNFALSGSIHSTRDEKNSNGLVAAAGNSVVDSFAIVARSFSYSVDSLLSLMWSRNSSLAGNANGGNGSVSIHIMPLHATSSSNLAQNTSAPVIGEVPPAPSKESLQPTVSQATHAPAVAVVTSPSQTRTIVERVVTERVVSAPGITESLLN
jgi:hypothetical protein